AYQKPPAQAASFTSRCGRRWSRTRTPRLRESMSATAAAAAAEIAPPAIRPTLGPNAWPTQPTSGDPSGAPPRNTSRYNPITRPRISAVVPSWVAELAAVVKVSSTTPIGNSTARNIQNDGISALSTSSAPNVNAVVSSSRAPARLRRAASSAPASAPAANTVEPSPNAPAPVWYTRRDIRAFVTWKFIPNVATKNTSTISVHRLGRDAT